MLRKLSRLIRFRMTNRESVRQSPRQQLGLDFLEDRSLMAPLTWSVGVDLPAARAGASAIETGYAILLIGGGTTVVNQLTPGGTAWGTASPIDIARTYAGVGVTPTNYLVYGGQNGTAVLGEALTYDPYNIDNVQDATVMTPPRTLFGYASDDTGHPFAIGGLNDQNAPLSSVTNYDATTATWQSAANLPQSLYSEAAVNDGNGHLLTFSGVDAGGAVTTTVYRYTMATNTWDTVAPMPVAERDGAAVLASNGKIYVLGGTAGGTTLATVQAYDPATNSWTIETDLPRPLSGLAVSSDSLGHIVVMGGYDQNHVAVSTVSVSQVLNAPDAAPVFTSTAPASVLVGATYSYQIATTGNPQATYALVSAPTGMTIDSGRGLITWTPTVAQAGLNSVTVRAVNFAGSKDQTFSVRALTPAPTTPTGLVVSRVTTNSVSLAWNASTDSIGVAGYRVYRVTHTGWRGNTTVYTKVSDVTGTSATISGLSAGYSYQYVVSAYNASGNESTRSAPVSATTQSPIIYTGPTTVSVAANHPLSFTLSASANPATFTYTALDPANGMTVNPTTGLVTWTPIDADVGADYFTFRIDHVLGSVTVIVAVQVRANVPYITSGATGQAVATQPHSLQFSQVPDVYNTSPVTYSLLSGVAGMSVDAATGLLTWTPTLADIGTASASVQITNYAGSTSTTVSIPVAFAAAPQSVAISHVRTTSATVSWVGPAVASEPIAGYTVTASYSVRSGRFITTHTLTFPAASTATSLVMTGLPANKLINVAVTPYDATNRTGWAGRTSFTTAAAVPTIVISGGPFTYDGTPQVATAIALGTNGVTQVTGSFTLTYNGSPVEPTTPGTYVVVAAFTSANPYYAETEGTGSITINPAAPVVAIGGGPFDYDGLPHAVTATAVGVDGITPVSGVFSFTYNGSPTVPTNPGIIAVIATFTSADPYYTNATKSGTLVIRSTGTQVPTLTIVGGPFTYDTTPHPVTATAKGAGNTPLAGTFSYTYNGSPTPPTAAGVYTVVATFASGDPAYRDDSVSRLFTINQAAPTADIGWFTYPGWGPTPSIIYDGSSHEATAIAYGIAGVTVPGTFAFTFTPIGTPTNAGGYAVTATFTSADPNYASTVFTASLTIAAYIPYVAVVVNTPAYPYWYGQYYGTYTGLPFGATATAYGVAGSVPGGSVTLSYYAYDPVTYTYTIPLLLPPVDVGSYFIQADYVSTDPNYANATGYTYLQIDPATPTVVTYGVFNYDGQRHDALAIAYGLDGVTPVAGSFTFNYNGLTTPPRNAGTYVVDAYFASADPNYTDSYASGFVTIDKVTPSFSNLSSPTVVVGTATTTVSGRLVAGTVYPTGDLVSIVINGVTRTATVNATGTFSVGFPTGTLPIGTYAITYSFAGDTVGFNAATNGTGTLNVIAPLVAPSVTTNPVSQTVTAGGTITFTAAANGNPTPTVQWQVSTNGGTSYTNLVGATSATLTITTTATQNAYRYRAVFTNSVGTATTTAAILTVQFAPVVSTNPTSQTIRSGNNVTFTTAATGNPTPTVQWQVSTNGGATFTNIAGATGTTYSFTTATAQNGNLYRAVFTNSIGTATTTAATLTVQFAPAVSTNPTSQTIRSGNSVTFTAAATGNPTPTVQWQVSTNGGTSYANITGATNPTLTITTSSALNGYRYRAVFTNSVGTATTSAATLTVQWPPLVTINPTDQTVTAGSRVTFTAAATGNPTPTVQWQISTDGGLTFINISGATSTTLSFPVTTAMRGYRYRAVFTNSIGTAYTNSALLNV